MASLQETACFNPGVNFVPICKSPLIVHVSKMFPSSINPHSLALISSRAVNLRSLCCEPFYAGAASDVEWVLPPKLTRLNVAFAADIPVALIDSFLAAAASLDSLGELDVDAHSVYRVSLEPLAQLHSLHTLRLSDRGESQVLGASASLTPKQLLTIHSLSRNLTSLQVLPGLSADALHNLFRPGHPFRLKDLGRSLRLLLTAELGALIASLPLEHAVIWPTDSLAFLPGLAPTMRYLQIQFSVCTVEPEAVVAALTSLTGLTELALGQGSLTSAHLAALMPALSRLRHLDLNSLRELQSLGFLSVAGAPQLESLSMLSCSHRHFSPLELQHLRRAQTQLGLLSLTHTFNVPLDPFCRSLLAPPSVLLPSLLCFDYQFDEPDTTLTEYEEEDAEETEEEDD